ncbi:DNA polymerase I [Mesoplasma lactucae]|uniref:DNA polymerase I n=1 Tax=Mesoplasma lactucae ATCC 49193 TaxID=81460 RepID=A0A291IS43_9MOLU|nr:DNA polymerase I [Mesoplasma lactucae]ATG97558.1 DNA polymerase I [Mesoplasma lactucae ATCC 49193]ATZ19983.1 DNA polymerase I [Mesoplasma lactucae ATCC 49193]MCL8217066.1 DNA polymerase I [Mesoplasma lactucae ATCC 49193]
MENKEQKKVLLVDGNSLIFRAYYGSAYSGSILRTTTGIPTNAVYSFANMLTSLIVKEDYYDVKVAFDKGKHTFRHDKLEDYKGGRQKTPPELVEQFPIAREFLKSANIDYFEMDDYEADDLIGSMAKKIYDENPDMEINILSSDKDMYQLINDRTFVLSPRSGTSDMNVIDEKALFEKWECLPKQVPDLKGLMGDSSDNLKGVQGVGEKGATKLICEYQTLDGIYSHIDAIKGKLKEKLINGKDDAYLCKDIATIETSVYIPNFKVHQLNITIEPLTDFLEKYEMKSLVRRFQNSAERINQEENINYEIIEEWKEEYAGVENNIFVESLEFNYHDGSVIGIGISNEKGNYFINFIDTKQLDIFSLSEGENINFDSKFNDFLKSDAKKNTYDIKRTLALLENSGYEPNPKSFVYDMMSACYILNPTVDSTFAKHLKLVSDTLSIDEDDLFYGKGVKKTADIDLNKKADFVIKKAVYLGKVKPSIMKTLELNNQVLLLNKIDYPLTFVLKDMEDKGVLIDRDELALQTRSAEAKISSIETDVKNMLGDKLPENFNLASPKQVKELLYDDLKLPNNFKGSTNREVLEAIQAEHAVVSLILEYRKWMKLYSTYLAGFEKYIHPDNRVYTIFKQNLTATGRLSSVEPNLQNISTRDDDQKEVRKIFIVDEGYTFYSYDYSQIELRVLAQMADEKHMLEIFSHEGDIHANSAARIFGVDPKDVTPDMRRTAKVFNFGIIYGLSAYGLSKDLNIGVGKAQDLITRYYETFPGIKTFKDKTLAFAEENGYVETMSRRRRYIPELKSKVRFQREFGERAAINMPIQGTAADILKIAMINIYNEFKKQNLKSFMSSQIHDEIIFSIKNEEIEIATKIIEEQMDKAFKDLSKTFEGTDEIKVKLEESKSSGNNWYQLK